jgi:cobalt-zinc-cadmium efflux system membrane fusion protein
MNRKMKMSSASIDSASPDGSSRLRGSGVRASSIRASFVLALLLIAGCGDHEAGEEIHEEHAEERVELLLFSGGTEWFIEHSPLIAGGTSSWLIHLTRLGDGKPVEVQSVHLRMDLAGGGPVEVQAKRRQAGIYAADVPLPAAGDAQLRLTFASAAASDTVQAVKIRIHASEKDAHAAADHADGEGIAFTKEQAWKMDFRTDPVRMIPFPAVIKTTGHLLTHPDQEREIPATAGGVLSYGGKPMLPGQRVSKGEVLATITGASLAGDNLEARIADATAQFTKARSEFERAQTLHAEDVIPRKSLEESKLRYEQAENALRTLNADVGASGKILRAPFAGYIKSVRRAGGAYVREGEAVVSIARNDRVLLKAEVYQNDFALLPTIHGAVFRGADNTSRDIRSLGGRLLSRGQAVDESAYSVPVYFELNGTGLIPGEFVDVYLQAGPEQRRLVIPITALSEELGRHFVYVQRGGERYERREVVIGGGDGVHVPVTSGLAEGERIVTQGMHALRLAASAGQVQAHAHAH